MDLSALDSTRLLVFVFLGVQIPPTGVVLEGVLHSCGCAVAMPWAWSLGDGLVG